MVRVEIKVPLKRWSSAAKDLTRQTLVASHWLSGDPLHSVGTLPARNEQTEALMKQRGIDLWGLRIYPMPNLEQAQLFDGLSGANTANMGASTSQDRNIRI